jgi:hypothetical protein
MDVQVQRGVTAALRLRPIDVLTAQDDGAGKLDDELLFQRATELGRVLISQDEDLLLEAAKRLSEHNEFSGLIYAHQLRITIGQMVEDLELIAGRHLGTSGGGGSSTSRSGESAFWSQAA